MSTCKSQCRVLAAARASAGGREDVQPNMSLSGTSAVTRQSSSRVSVSMIVPLRWLMPPMTLPVSRESVSA